MDKKYSIAEAKNRLPAIVHETEHNDPIFLLRRGQPVAVLLSTHEYERLQARQKRGFWSALTSFRDNALRMSDVGVTDDDFSNLRDASPGREPDVF